VQILLEMGNRIGGKWATNWKVIYGLRLF